MYFIQSTIPTYNNCLEICNTLFVQMLIYFRTIQSDNYDTVFNAAQYCWTRGLLSKTIFSEHYYSNSTMGCVGTV